MLEEDSGVARRVSLKYLAVVWEVVARRAQRLAVDEGAVGRVKAFARHRTAGLADIVAIKKLL